MIDFLIITALPEELDALLEALEDYEELDKDHDTSTYYAARLSTQRKDNAVYDIRATCLSGMGPINAAAHAVVAASRWSAQNVLMIGIAGGFGDDVALGDILLADQVADYTLGKVYSTETEDVVREVRWTALPTDRCLLDSAIRLRDWQSAMPKPPTGTDLPKLARGTIVSGGDVMTATRLAKEHQAVWPKIVGFEMEGGAIATALHTTFARPRFFMIRSVQDLADPEKKNTEKAGWRQFACEAAAKFTVALLRRGPLPGCPRPPEPQASASGASPSSGDQRQLDRARDVAALKRIMAQIALDEFDYFIERAKNYVIPSQILYYFHGFYAAQRAQLNYVVDPVLRGKLEHAADTFDRALGFQNHFSPRGDDCILDVRGVSNSNEVVDRYCGAVDEAEEAMRQLTVEIREHWSEIDLEETSKTAREMLRAEDGAFGPLVVVDEEQPLDDAAEALWRRAHAVPLAFVEGEDSQDVTLHLDSRQEREAAQRLQEQGRPVVVEGDSCTITVERSS